MYSEPVPVQLRVLPPRGSLLRSRHRLSPGLPVMGTFTCTCKCFGCSPIPGHPQLHCHNSARGCNQ